MGTNEERLRAQWRADLVLIAAQIDDLKARIDAQSRKLYASLSAEVAALQSELSRLERDVDAAGADEHARQIAAQIEALSAKGDAAYELLQSEMPAQIDPTDAEIRRLQAAEANASEDAKAKIQAHIDQLRSTQAAQAARARAHGDDWAEQTGDEPR